jgi:hypothetical protein
MTREQKEYSEEAVAKIIPLQESDISQALLNSISNSIYPFVVGLVHKDDLIGSGTLVRLGDRRGILTAYHVVHDVVPKFDFRAGSQDFLGLIILPHEHVHRFEIPLGVGVMTVIDIARPQREDSGPDLAFIELKPSHHLNQLDASRDFFNLGVNREKGLRMNLSDRDPMVISGFCHEGHTTEVNKDGFSVVKGFKGFAGFTRIERRSEYAHYDLCDVTVDYSLGDDPPKNFGGYSGGGLWHVVLTKNEETGKVSHRSPMFSGVVFYQEQVTETRKILRCHLTNSIYRHAIDAIARGGIK